MSSLSLRSAPPRFSALAFAAVIPVALMAPSVARADDDGSDDYATVAEVAQAAPAPGTPKTDATTGKPAPTEQVEVVQRYPKSSARWKVIVAGAAVTVVAYGGAALTGGLWNDYPGADMLYIPVAGPWIALGQSGCAPDEETSPGAGDCEAIMGARAAIYIVDGLLQLGGLALVAEGIFMTTESDQPPAATVVPVPFVSEHTAGLSLFGRF
ncbi:MAG: hypothetical protein U0271_12675 [Polyangiaceae bacterium]